MSLLYATHARVHLGNVCDNLRAIRAAVGPSRKVLIAVKANGYGHGAVEVDAQLGAVCRRGELEVLVDVAADFAGDVAEVDHVALGGAA